MVGTVTTSGTAGPTLPPPSRFTSSKDPWNCSQMTKLATVVLDQVTTPQEQWTKARRQGRPNLQVRPHHLGWPHLSKLLEQVPRPQSLKGTLLRMILTEGTRSVQSIGQD
jgi:hypothetical protein